MRKNPFGGLTVLAGFLLAASVTAGMIAEYYKDPLDDLVGTQSSMIVTEETDDEGEIWNYEQEFKTAKEAFEGYKEFALRQSEETIALLKNENSALPLAKGSNVTMMGLRSYAPFYGNNGGSIPDMNTILNGNTITEAFEAEGFNLNPSMLGTYEAWIEANGGTFGPPSYGATAPEYTNIMDKTKGTIFELSPTELAAQNSAYNSQYSSYNDAAIVVVGRGAGEQNEYNLSTSSTGDNQTTTGNVMSLSEEERAVIAEAKANFSKVIVIINATNTMEFKELVEDDGIDAIVWAGHPGAYGWYSVAKVLNGDVNPSAHLGDTYATNNAVNPAMQSFGYNYWANRDSFESAQNVNSYLVEAEGIYAGYRYYETRYADIVMNRGTNPASASAGTYTGSDYRPATVPGTWSYDHEVIYPFGYGLSYTTFEQEITDFRVMGDKRTAYVTVRVTNTGDVAGKSVIQLYAQSPYTEYDRQNGVEKSAIQLMDFEKTPTLAPDEPYEVTMEVDMSNLASYDYRNAKTFILDAGDYYFTLGNDAHDAVNRVLARQDYSVTGVSEAARNDVEVWSNSSLDTTTFSVSPNGVNITNQVSEGDYSMDLNSFDGYENTVTYLTRDNWDGTFPESYAGLSATGRLATLLGNDFISLKNDANPSDYVWGEDNGLSITQFKDADWNDPRWDDLVDQVPVEEFLDFAANAFHNVQQIPSVGYVGHPADDGPGGSDSHYFDEGSYRGQAFTDGADYEDLGTRVTCSQTNIAYSFNKELAYENGEIILGETSLMLGLPIIIGPAMNIHRHGYNGRGGEYFSEDPILSGYIGSNVVQGAQSKGVLVNIKHAAFNDQEQNRSGIAVFMNEQKARELELRNLQQAFVGNGKAAAWRNNSEYDDAFDGGASGVMTSYNRIGAVAPSANYNVMVNIMREERGFKGYNVTDFTGISLKAAPKESILAGTTAFCGFGSIATSGFEYLTNPSLLTADADMSAAIKKNIKYILYSLANSNAMYGINSTSRQVQLMTWWRGTYIGAIATTAVLSLGFAGLYIWGEATKIHKKEEN